MIILQLFMNESTTSSAALMFQARIAGSWPRCGRAGYKNFSMRILCVLSLALFSCFVAAAQGTGNKLADSIDTARTIIAKLDHAAQDDPPPNFASSVLVRNHNDAVKFMSLADSVSASVRLGNDPGATSIFTLYSRFIDLFDQFDLYTTVETRHLALDKVRSVAMSKEYFETKTYLEAVTYALVMRAEDELKACHATKAP